MIWRITKGEGGELRRRRGRNGRKGKKQMEGDNRQRRQTARLAREQGRKPSEIRGTLGASKQRTEAGPEMTHQQKIDLMREGKQPVIEQHTSQGQPGSRDEQSPDRERFPRRKA
jgi:hypothetical protein